MVLTNEWFSSLGETEKGDSIFITGRDDIEAFKDSGKFKQRVEIYWKYTADSKGMPLEQDAKLINEVQETLQKAMEKDKLAILTGIYTGDGERTWVFYVRTSQIFGERLNTTLQHWEQLLPITIYVENDSEWNEYREMYESKEFGE